MPFLRHSRFFTQNPLGTNDVLEGIATRPAFHDPKEHRYSWPWQGFTGPGQVVECELLAHMTMSRNFASLSWVLRALAQRNVLILEGISDPLENGGTPKNASPVCRRRLRGN